MEYLSVEQAKNHPGLRLVLTRGVPGPWSEAAKAIFGLRKLDYAAVTQVGGRDNAELIEWTGHRNAPIALLENEPPRVRWLEILDLAERLGSGPSLYPGDRRDRIQMVGLINEIAGEGGFAWNARLLMLHAGVMARGELVGVSPSTRREYQYDAGRVEEAKMLIESFLDDFAALIKTQYDNGSRYLVGSNLTAADVYWAYFSNMLQSLPPEQNPMPDGLRQSWAVLGKSVQGWNKVLIEHRDRIFEEHLILPLSF